MCHCSILNLFLTCSYFLSSFSLTVLITSFLLKSLALIYTKKKENKRKQLLIKELRVLFRGEKNVGCDLSVEHFFWGQFSSGSFVQGQLCRRQIIEKGIFLGGISRGILSWSNYLWGNCPGAIIRGKSSKGAVSRGEFSSGAIKLGGNCPLEGNFPRGQLPGGIIWGAIIQGVIFR